MKQPIIQWSTVFHNRVKPLATLTDRQNISVITEYTARVMIIETLALYGIQPETKE